MSNPETIYPGGNPNGPPTNPTAAVPLNSTGAGGTTSTTTTTVGSTSTTPNEQINQTPTGGLTFDQVENIWIQAGGNPQAAQMAAAIADASSGLNTAATYTNPDGTQSVGLWLIPTNGMPPGSTDPMANARAAIQLSQNGTDWSQWCSAWSDNDCGCQGGSYLGDGSNALASLMGQNGSFNVIGSNPSGTGVGASTATAGVGTPTTTTSSTSKYLIIGVLIVLILAVFIMVRRKAGASGAPQEGADNPESRDRSQEAWTPAEEAMLSEKGRSDKELSSELGRSVRSIRVRRNQMKSR